MSIQNVSLVSSTLLSSVPKPQVSSVVDGGFETVLSTQLAQAPAPLQGNQNVISQFNSLVAPLDALTRRGETLVAQLLDEDDISLDAVDSTETIEALDQGINFDSAFDTEPDLDPLETSRLAVTPFQFFIDKSVDLFRKVSGMEWRADRLMEEYARGNISIEEMTIVKAETGVAISFAVTLVTQVTAAFNELKNMQI